jgi:hypothetical protein
VYEFSLTANRSLKFLKVLTAGVYPAQAVMSAAPPDLFPVGLLVCLKAVVDGNVSGRLPQKARLVAVVGVAEVSMTWR